MNPDLKISILSIWIQRKSTVLVVRPETKNSQIRFDQLGFNAGAVDGKYGKATRLVGEAFQQSFRWVVLAVDGVGRQTKEAASNPAGS